MSEEEFHCPTHGGPYSTSEWWSHGDECADMCVDCEPFHTSDVGCMFVSISMDFMEGRDA